MTFLFKIIKQQKQRFDVFSTPAKRLIVANLLFGLFNPFYLIFANTFIFNNTKGNLSYNLLYAVCTFIGIVLGFIVNGYLIKRFHIKNTLVFGCFLLFASIVVLFCMPAGTLTGFWVFVFGLCTGVGNGIYWSSRNYLTIVNTQDNNRDFFAGLDFILNSCGRVITPLLIGLPVVHFEK